MSWQPSSQNDWAISIDDSLTTLEKRGLVGSKIEVPTGEVAKIFFDNTQRDTGLLPPVVRYVSSNLRAFLIERPPFVANITYSFEDKTYTYAIPIPWNVYYILTQKEGNEVHLSAFQVWFRNEPIYTEEDPLYHLPLPNRGSGYVCPSLTKIKEDDIGFMLNAFISGFWDSAFNNDISLKESHVPEYFKKNFDLDSRDWNTLFSRWSKLNLDQMLDIGYVPSSKTVGELIQIAESAANEGAKEINSLFNYLRVMVLNIKNKDKED